jgi:hypothetical protein
MSTGAIVVLVIVVVLVLGAGAWFVMQQSRRRRLQDRFGPEYDRRIKETDDRRVVERELTEREKRHASFDLHTLSDSERVRYAEQWTVVQEQFVDQPGEAVVAAEHLVHAVMRDRGYPTDGEFEQHASDLSVEHSTAVPSFRGGHEIRTRHEQAGVSTEELRLALQHYRKIFVSLVGVEDDHDHDQAHDHTHDHTHVHADSADRAHDTADTTADGTADVNGTVHPAAAVTEVPAQDVPVHDNHRVDETKRTNRP